MYPHSKSQFGRASTMPLLGFERKIKTWVMKLKLKRNQVNQYKGTLESDDEI